MEKQTLPQALKTLGLGFVRIDSPTQTMTVLAEGELSQVCGGAESTVGATRATSKVSSAKKSSSRAGTAKR